MTGVARTGAPLPTQEAPAAPGRRAGLDRGWQREMEKAQARDWFHGAIGQAAGERGAADAQSRGEQGVPGAVPHGAVPEQSALRSVPGAGDAPVATPSPVRGLEQARPIASGIRTSPGTLAVHLALQARPPAPDLRVAPPRSFSHADRVEAPVAAQHEATPAPVRIHVEDAPDGVHVWFGLAGDGAAVAARAQALLQELRRECGSTGRRLALVVCNGETVFAAGPSSDAGRRADSPPPIPPQEP